MTDKTSSSKRVSAEICPLCDGTVLAPESLALHIKREHPGHVLVLSKSDGDSITTPDGHTYPTRFENEPTDEDAAFKEGASMAFQIARCDPEDHVLRHGHFDLCYHIWPGGPNGEFLACGHAKGHKGDHSWSWVPTVVGEPIP